MRPDSDEYYYYQWCGRMRWTCVRGATGRDCNWVLACSLGPIVPGRSEIWKKYQQLTLRKVRCVIISKKHVPNYVDGAPSDCKMPAVHVQENSTISDTTLVSKSRIYEEDGEWSDCKKDVPSII
jgi:hypothetical protein